MRQITIPPVFVLCPPRSQSTVAVAMLGLHPQLCAFPELNLFADPTVGETARRTIRMNAPQFLGGLWRALAFVHEGSQSYGAIQRARAWTAERHAWTGGQVFTHLAERVAPRVAVEKSPALLLDPESLERMLAAFPSARLVHLTRNPAPAIRSLSRLFPSGLALGRSVHTRAASTWLRAHEAIMRLCERLPCGQSRRVQVEDLLQHPEREFPPLLRWLGVSEAPDLIARMRHPEHWTFASAGPENAALGGDPVFLSTPHRRADNAAPGPVEADDPFWQDIDGEVRRRLFTMTETLGYAIRNT